MKKKLVSAVSALTILLSSAAFPQNDTRAAEEYLIRDKWGYCKTANYAESEHFVIFWGKSDRTGKVNDAFIKRNLDDYEKLWKCYSEYLGMDNINTDIYEKSPQRYKTCVYLTETGLDKYPDGWAFMSSEDGYGIEIISPEAMLDDLTIAHEFGHVVTMQQKAWVDQEITGAWWEPLANWFREMYLDSEYYTGQTETVGFEPYLRNMSLTFPHGRNYYEVWPFMMYLSKNPDNLPGLGVKTMKRIISEARPDEYPFDTITRLFGTDAQTVFGHYAKRMATFDFGRQEAYQNEFRRIMKDSPYYWNLFYTVPEKSADGWLASPQEEAPMQGGINIIPLKASGSKITVDFRGISDDPNASWQACIVTVDASGNESYSELFGNGETMSINASAGMEAYLTVTAMPGKLVRVNAFHKEKDTACRTGTEKRRYPYEIRISGADITQSGGYSVKNIPGHAHPNGGGFVSSQAKVSDSVYVGPDAVVLGNAVLSGNARIEDHAVVSGNVTVKDNAVISGYAVVDANGWVYDNGWKTAAASVSGNALITDRAVAARSVQLSGNAKVIQKAYVNEAVSVTENAVIKGNAYLYGNAVYSGNAVIDGDYSNDVSRNSGISTGWLDDSGTGKIPDGYIASYDFSDKTEYWAEDSYSSTRARIISTDWADTRTSARGVLQFDGNSSEMLLDSSLLRSSDIQISFAALYKGGKTEQEIFRTGDDSAYMKFTPESRDGKAVFILTDGKTTETLSSETALKANEWNKVTIEISSGTGTLYINGKAADSGKLTLNPAAILSCSSEDNTVIGAGFTGALDYFRVYSQKTAEPDIKYTGSEKPETVKGDVNADGVFNIQDFTAMVNYILGVTDDEIKNSDAADLNGDTIINAADLVMLKSMLLK